MNKLQLLENRRGTLSEKYESCDKDLMPFFIAEHDYALPKEVHEVLLERAAHPSFGYSQKSPELEETWCSWMQRRHKLSYREDALSFFPSTLQVLLAAIEILSQEGDHVLIPSPVYPPFFDCVKALSRKALPCPLPLVDGRYQMTDDFLKALPTKKAPLLLLCHPHNPSGRLFSKKELSALAIWAKTHGVAIFSDEIHSDFAPPKDPENQGFHSLFSLAPKGLSLITAYSSSKTFGMTGMPLALSHASSPALKEALDAYITKRRLSPFHPLSLPAYMKAWESADPWLDALIQELDKHHDQLEQALVASPYFQPIKRDVGLVFWVKALWDPQKLSPADLCKDALKARVSEGTPYGPHSECFFRLSLGEPRSSIDKITSSIAEVRIKP